MMPRIIEYKTAMIPASVGVATPVRMEPKMISGARRAGRLSLIA